MANIKSAQKDIQTSRRNRERNLAYKTRMKGVIKKALQAVESKSENAKEVVREALQIIDKTAAKGIIKKQTAARKKSRLSLKLNKSAQHAEKKGAEKKAVKKVTSAKKAPAEKASAAKKSKKKSA